ncbi:putative sugar transporter [Penicillium brasilianum]|uniref:Putative sugar transporter n=1 Tax=Penicillium brasilianum TaxID=104259 RepID=A0A1S9RM10_PENBI|nr:putative sugar transporter [Penicillium brasilianum]
MSPLRNRFESRLQGKLLVNLITVVCSVGFSLFGYDQGVMANLIGADNQFGKTFNHPNARLQGTIVAIYELTAFVGSIAVIFVGDYLGRRRTLNWGIYMQLLGVVIQCSSYSVAQLIVGRCITGIGIGMLTAGVPVYQAECCPAHDRGRNACIFNWICICGVTSSYWIGYGSSFLSNQAQWRFPVAFQATFSVVILFMVHILPESPRWLVHHGFTDEARRVIARLVGTNVELDDSRVQSLQEEIQVAVATEREAGNMSIREMFSSGNLRNGRRMLLCLAAGLGCQMSGINLITQYAPIIFQNSIGMSRGMSQLVAGFNSLEYMLATIPPIFYIEKVGRRKVLMWGAFGQSMTMMVLAITVHNGGYTAGIVGAAMLFLFNTIFAQGWLTCPWLYASEICTLQLRARGAAMASAGFWIINFAVVEFTPSAIDNIGWQTYIIFTVFNAVFIPLVYYFFPETTNLQLEDMDYLFELKGWTAGARGEARERIQMRHDQENARRREQINSGTEKSMVEHIEKATDGGASSSNESQHEH